MATGVINNMTGSLDEELEKARETLRSVDESIKKLFGKEATELPTFGQRARRKSENTTEDYYDKNATNGRASRIRRGEDSYPDEPWEKRRRNIDGTSGGTRGRLGRDDDDIGGGRLQSRIVTSAKEKSRDEVLAEQREDRKGLTRNRRMFGALLGTLQRFKQDETKLKEKEEKRAQIEAKLEEAARNEREGVRKEKQQLIRDRKVKLTEIRRLEVKKTRLAELEQWETQTRHLSNFIRTDAKPHIFYRPRIMNPVMECKLEQSKQLVAEMIAAKRKETLEDLEKYEQKTKRYWEQRLDDRNSRRTSTDQLDEDMEEELKEVMKTEDVPTAPETDGDTEIAEDFTVVVSTVEEPDDEGENNHDDDKDDDGEADPREDSMNQDESGTEEQEDTQETTMDTNSDV